MNPQKPTVVPLPFSQPSKTPTSPEMKAVKQRGNLKLVAGVLSTLLGTGGVGYATHKSGDGEVQKDVAVVQQQLKDHIEKSDERNVELKINQEKLYKRTRKIELNQLINKAQNDLVLDKLGVPKSKRPTADDVEPVEDE